MMTTPPESKSEIVAEIAALLGVEAPPMSSGSTEPKAIFVLIIERLGLGIDTRMTKPDLAREIVRASGEGWDPDFESRGATITKPGLLAVLAAVEFWMGAATCRSIDAEAPSPLKLDHGVGPGLDNSEDEDGKPDLGRGTAAARGSFITQVAQNLDAVVHRFGLRRCGAVNIRRGGVFYTLPRRLEIAEFIVARVVSAAHFVDVGFYLEHYPERRKNWQVAELLRHTYGPLLSRYDLHVDTWHGSGAGVKRDRIITRLAGGYVDGDPAAVASTAAHMLAQWTRMLLEHPIKGVAAAVRERAVEDGASAIGLEEDGLWATPRVGAETPTLLHLHAVLTTAEGQDEERGFLVYEGARARREEGVMISGYKQLRRKLVGDGTLSPLNDHQYQLTRNYYFESPSAAASILSGGSKNGRKEWKAKSGLTLKELQERTQPTQEPDEKEDDSFAASSRKSPDSDSSQTEVAEYRGFLLDLQDIRDHLRTLRERCRELEGSASATYLALSNAITGLDEAIAQAQA